MILAHTLLAHMTYDEVKSFRALHEHNRFHHTNICAAGLQKLPEDSYFKNHVLPTLKRRKR